MDNFKILIVDDEPDLLEVCLDSFEMEGFVCLGAENGEKALELVKSDPSIKIVITDANMNIMGGVELIKKINEFNLNIVSYLATGDLDFTDEDVKKIGGSGLLIKPYDIDETIEKIKGLEVMQSFKLSS